MIIITKILNLETQKEFEIIKINEYEELLLKDLNDFMKRIAKENSDYYHDKLELRKNCPANEPKNAKGHLRCFLLETSQIIPILNFEMQLGKYQDIFAVETSGPRKRELIIQICGE